MLYRIRLDFSCLLRHKLVYDFSGLDEAELLSDDSFEICGIVLQKPLLFFKGPDFLVKPPDLFFHRLLLDFEVPVTRKRGKVNPQKQEKRGDADPKQEKNFPHERRFLGIVIVRRRSDGSVPPLGRDGERVGVRGTF